MIGFGEEVVYLLLLEALMAEQTSERIPMNIVDFGTLLC